MCVEENDKRGRKTLTFSKPVVAACVCCCVACARISQCVLVCVQSAEQDICVTGVTSVGASESVCVSVCSQQRCSASSYTVMDFSCPESEPRRTTSSHSRRRNCVIKEPVQCLRSCKQRASRVLISGISGYCRPSWKQPDQPTFPPKRQGN